MDSWKKKIYNPLWRKSMDNSVGWVEVVRTHSKGIGILKIEEEGYNFFWKNLIIDI